LHLRDRDIRALPVANRLGWRAGGLAGTSPLVEAILSAIDAEERLLELPSAAPSPPTGRGRKRKT
jgi:hypothetical protein